MPKQNIKYTDIDKIGMELFRKNNASYICSSLSDVMERIFIAANAKSRINECTDERYMKSGFIPGRVYYIYSDQVENKIFDIVNLNDETCIWFYSNNVINRIDEHPGEIAYEIFSILIDTFFRNDLSKYTINDFIYIENQLLKYVMSIRLMIFLNEEYGIIDTDKFKKELSNEILTHTDYQDLDPLKFIDDIIDNCKDIDYFSKRKYLDSYKLLFK